MLVVGGNLAQIKIFKFDKMPMLSLVLAKLILLPLLALIILFKLKVNPLVGLLIIMQAAMPPATSLSLIARHYKIREEFINQGVFITHIVSLITIPLFLGLYGRL
jgi:predicted permease